MPTKSKPTKASAPTATKHKKRKEPEPEPDQDLALSDSESEPSAAEDSDEYEEPSASEESDEEEEEVDEEEVEGMTDEEVAAHTQKLKSQGETRRKTKVRRRGLRKVATLAGFSSKYASAHPDRDVCTPVLSMAETIRAAKWAPKLANKAAFEGLEEFKERTELAYDTSLPPGAAKVLQANGEIFLRRLVLGSVQRQADMARTSTTAAMVAAETRPLRRALKYSFVGSDLKGLVRYAQTSASGEKLSMFDGELNDIEAEEEAIEQQKATKKVIMLRVSDKKALRKAKKTKSTTDTPEAQPTPQPKKKKKSA